MTCVITKIIIIIIINGKRGENRRRKTSIRESWYLLPSWQPLLDSLCANTVVQLWAVEEAENSDINWSTCTISQGMKCIPVMRRRLKTRDTGDCSSAFSSSNLSVQMIILIGTQQSSVADEGWSTKNKKRTLLITHHRHQGESLKCIALIGRFAEWLGPLSSIECRGRLPRCVRLNSYNKSTWWSWPTISLQMSTVFSRHCASKLGGPGLSDDRNGNISALLSESGEKDSESAASKPGAMARGVVMGATEVVVVGFGVLASPLPFLLPATAGGKDGCNGRDVVSPSCELRRVCAAVPSADIDCNFLRVVATGLLSSSCAWSHNNERRTISLIKAFHKGIIRGTNRQRCDV